MHTFNYMFVYKCSYTSNLSLVENVTATTVPPHEPYYSCDEKATLDDIIRNQFSSDPNAMTCQSTGNHESHEAFVLTHCPDVPRNTSTWKGGINVRNTFSVEFFKFKGKRKAVLCRQTHFRLRFALILLYALRTYV